MNMSERERTFPRRAALEEEAAILWRGLRETGSSADREALFNLYAPFARRIARRQLSSQLKQMMELAELNQLAFAGLLEAIDSFDPSRSVPFEGYAIRRISGSILDGVARHTEVSEQISFRRRMRSERVRSVASPAEPDASPADNLARLAEAAISLALGYMLEGTNLYQDAEPASANPSAYDGLAWKDMLRRLTREVAHLSAREQTIIRQHYLNGMNFDQIADLLGLTKGRISQLHKQSLLTLKVRLARAGDFSLTR